MKMNQIIILFLAAVSAVFAETQDLCRICSCTPNKSDDENGGQIVDCSWRQLSTEQFESLILPEQTVILNLSGNDFADGTLPEDIFQNNADCLVEINLSVSQLSWLPSGIFYNLVSLERLDLSYNQLSDLEPGIFGDLQMLQELNLDFNQLTSLNLSYFIPTGGYWLKTLSAQQNLISNLDPDLLLNSGKLETLKLAANRIEAVDVNLLEPASETLINLDLSNNYINYLPQYFFKGMIAISYLDLSNNDIKHLSRPVVLAPLSSTLRKVNLSYNDLEELSPDTFNSFTEIETVSLAGNRLTTIERNIWGLVSPGVSINSLLELDLSNNELRHLDEDVLATMMPLFQQNALVTLNMANNPWQCDTRMAYVNQYGTGTASLLGHFADAMICKGPTKATGTPLSQWRPIIWDEAIKVAINSGSETKMDNFRQLFGNCPGNVIGNATIGQLNDCSHRCLLNKECVGFTFTLKEGTCLLKSKTCLVPFASDVNVFFESTKIERFESRFTTTQSPAEVFSRPKRTRPPRQTRSTTTTIATTESSNDDEVVLTRKPRVRPTRPPTTSTAVFSTLEVDKLKTIFRQWTLPTRPAVPLISFGTFTTPTTTTTNPAVPPAVETTSAKTNKVFAETMTTFGRQSSTPTKASVAFSTSTRAIVRESPTNSPSKPISTTQRPSSAVTFTQTTSPSTMARNTPDRRPQTPTVASKIPTNPSFSTTATSTRTPTISTPSSRSVPVTPTRAPYSSPSSSRSTSPSTTRTTAQSTKESTPMSTRTPFPTPTRATVSSSSGSSSKTTATSTTKALLNPNPSSTTSSVLIPARTTISKATTTVSTTTRVSRTPPTPRTTTTRPPTTLPLRIGLAGFGGFAGLGIAMTSKGNYDVTNPRTALSSPQPSTVITEIKTQTLPPTTRTTLRTNQQTVPTVVVVSNSPSVIDEAQRNSGSLLNALRSIVRFDGPGKVGSGTVQATGRVVIIPTMTTRQTTMMTTTTTRLVTTPPTTLMTTTVCWWCLPTRKLPPGATTKLALSNLPTIDPKNLFTQPPVPTPWRWVPPSTVATGVTTTVDPDADRISYWLAIASGQLKPTIKPQPGRVVGPGPGKLPGEVGSMVASYQQQQNLAAYNTPAKPREVVTDEHGNWIDARLAAFWKTTAEQPEETTTTVAATLWTPPTVPDWLTMARIIPDSHFGEYDPSDNSPPEIGSNSSSSYATAVTKLRRTTTPVDPTFLLMVSQVRAMLDRGSITVMTTLDPRSVKQCETPSLVGGYLARRTSYDMNTAYYTCMVSPLFGGNVQLAEPTRRSKRAAYRPVGFVVATAPPTTRQARNNQQQQQQQFITNRSILTGFAIGEPKRGPNGENLQDDQNSGFSNSVISNRRTVARSYSLNCDYKTGQWVGNADCIPTADDVRRVTNIGFNVPKLDVFAFCIGTGTSSEPTYYKTQSDGVGNVIFNLPAFSSVKCYVNYLSLVSGATVQIRLSDVDFANSNRCDSASLTFYGQDEAAFSKNDRGNLQFNTLQQFCSSTLTTPFEMNGSFFGWVEYSTTTSLSAGATLTFVSI